jgi:hypothetical protein
MCACANGKIEDRNGTRDGTRAWNFQSKRRRNREKGEGEDLGKIEDVIIDAPNARVSYAILSFGGFLGMGDKLFALPWVSLFYSPENGNFALKADKELLKRAPGFDRNSWPDLSDPAGRADIYRYYSAEIYWS